MLEVRDLEIRYGPFLAVDKVSLEVRQGEIVGVIGPNGAGKSSVVRAITGLVRPTGGTVSFAVNQRSTCRCTISFGAGCRWCLKVGDCSR